MPFVMDASAAAKLFLNEPATPHFRAWYVQVSLQTEGLLAPSLLRYELGQILVREDRRDAAKRRDVLDQATAGLVFDDRTASAAFDHAPPLSFYDAAYLALALDAKAALVTYDRELLAAAKAAGCKTLSPGAA